MAGRPTKFSASVALKMIQLYRQGKTDAQVAGIIDVAEDTITRWKRSKPEFFWSIKEAKAEADELVEASLFAVATGYSHPEEVIFSSFGKITRVTRLKHYPPDSKAAIYWLNNRRPDDWQNKPLAILPPPNSHADIVVQGKKTFEEFCECASYPRPFEKQIEMMTFGLHGEGARLILGARGYGKTDYVVILGVAYELYLDPQMTTLIITKSKERNASMLNEIAAACIANGVVFEKQNSSCLRIEGSKGKDHSVSAVTIKTVTLRGRHPKRVIMDDPVTEDDTSEATRILVEKKYNEVNKLCGNILIIGQPAHKFDLYEKLRPLLRKLEVPHGTIPELDHDLEAQRLAGVDEASIEKSYFLKVSSDGDVAFSKLNYLDLFPPGDSVAFIDPSFEGGDYTAMSILRAWGSGVAVVGFVWKKAWDHCLDDMKPLLIKYRVRKLCFETNCLGTQPLDVLRSGFGNIGIIGRKSNTHKHSRIMLASAFAGLIHLSRESHKVYTDQVIKYEYNSKNDDAPDSLASCLEWIGLIKGKI